MSWKPFLRLRTAQARWDRHWWDRLSNGDKLHHWLSVTTQERSNGAAIFQFVAGPICITVAAREATP